MHDEDCIFKVSNWLSPNAYREVLGLAALADIVIVNDSTLAVENEFGLYHVSLTVQTRTEAEDLVEMMDTRNHTPGLWRIAR